MMKRLRIKERIEDADADCKCTGALYLSYPVACMVTGILVLVSMGNRYSYSSMGIILQVYDGPTASIPHEYVTIFKTIAG